ncbi:helix-turn-helix transcriptional regulator [Elizabethkingia anophelis]|nr:helix-turn-helix transcriptional regulator [Elizabethkingia anophelis]MCT4063412.1 helix-turn-helix transcriptional regulator [Elizabethkingia anophelis]MCT4109704.1 helix-turn-helix transcriptional regulator [Elizabethkingia anophelis]
MKKSPFVNIDSECKTRILAIKDTMEILSGKWKFHILGTLIQTEKLHFMELLREVDGIGAKMLSKELNELELNQLVKRKVIHTKPVTVEYKITQYGKTIAPIIDEIANWGISYRKALHSPTEANKNI